ncbi:VanZ family protein [Bifidobacterium sp. SO4]|uniref:VanZ family protein n=1 Tax=Bifidobacterium sp. SO4 TaxID=2809030 RepID=UPI001BDC6CC8|nr:VanZ family protein [Bifidobacterium sp. SO4]MBT1169800.1 VanZ family protein [Bifidobacterium sp. SO4]
MLRYLSYFSMSFIIAGVLWPIVSAVLTLPILAVHYHRHHRLRLLSAAADYLTVLYVLGLVAFTLYPMPDEPESFCEATAGQYAPQLDPLRFIEDVRYSGMTGVLQLVMNVVLFVPLGFVVARWLRWRWWAVLASGFVVSLLIETSQLTGFWGLYPCAYRQFDVDDLITNALGALVGCWLAVAFGRWVPTASTPGRGDVNRKPGALHRAVAFAIDMIFVVLVYFPITFGVVLLFYKVAEPLQNGDFTLFGGRVTVGVDWLNFVAPAVGLLAFLIFQLLIPVCHRGQTLGGMYTHMTVETRDRRGGWRAAFYVLRTAVLGAMTFALIAGIAFGGLTLRYALYGFAALFLFELVVRRAPWDLLP